MFSFHLYDLISRMYSNNEWVWMDHMECSSMLYDMTFPLLCLKSELMVSEAERPQLHNGFVLDFCKRPLVCLQQ